MMIRPGHREPLLVVALEGVEQAFTTSLIDQGILVSVGDEDWKLRRGEGCPSGGGTSWMGRPDGWRTSIRRAD